MARITNAQRVRQKFDKEGNALRGTIRERMRGSGPAKSLSHYDPELNSAIQLMARGGGTPFEIANALGITPQTLFTWATHHPEVHRALYVQGKEIWDDRIEASLATRAMGFWVEDEKIFCTDGKVTRVPTRTYVPADVGAIKLWLSQRRPEAWGEKGKMDVDVTLKTDEADPRTMALAVMALLRRASDAAPTIDLTPALQAAHEVGDDDDI